MRFLSITVSFLSEESGGKALGYGMSISEIPLMVFLGYVVGKALGREVEGALAGAVLGIIVLAAYAVWAYRNARPVLSGGGKPSVQPTR
jgi:hypothetical protein